MTRPLRIDFDGAFHHITNRGSRRQAIFLEPADRYEMYDLIDRAHERFGIVIHSFSFMTNHIHLVMETPEGNLSKALHLIESVYVRRFNRRHGFDGPLFKDRFYSRLISNDEYLYNAILYVMANPLDAGLVDQLGDYPWSSYPYFIQDPMARPQWLSSGGLEMQGIRTRRQLDRAIDGRSATKFDPEHYPEVLGSDAFIQAALERANAGEETIGHVRRALVRPSLDEIDSAVSQVLDVAKPLLRNRAYGQPSTVALGRAIAVSLAQSVGAQPLRSIALHYGFASGQSAGVTVSRLRKRARADERLALRIEEVRQVLAGLSAAVEVKR